MEEDTGKSLHVGGATGRIHGADHSLVDYNRAGIPLIEIVTKPIDRHRRARAGDRPRLRRARCATCCGRSASRDVRMEQGSLRCDANVSLRPLARRDVRAPGPRPRTSTRCGRVERAVRYEISRQAALLRAGGRDRAGDPALARGHRRHHLGPVQGARPRTTATSPSPTSCRSRPTRAWVEALRGDPARAARRSAAGGCRPTGATADLEMRDVVNAGALELVAETVDAGASPAAARKWWTQELARRANARGRRAGRRCR